MNQHPHQNVALLKNLVIYTICSLIAIVVGYWAVSAASAPTRSALSLMGFVALALTTPIFLRWHHPLLVFSWNLPASIFFLQGNPLVAFAMIGISLGISLLQRATNRNMRFIHAPQITLPLCLLIAVALVTAHFTGGIGLHSLGSDVMGGKKYVQLILGLLGFFALTARRVPPEKAGLYVGLFFLSGCASVISDFASLIPSGMAFIYYVIPASGYLRTDRLAGTGSAAMAIFTFMMIRYGVRGIFLGGKLWRPIVFALAFFGIFLGGFRSAVGLAAIAFVIQFFLERLHKTKLLPLFIFLGIFAATLCVPFSDKLPLPAQRALAWLPLKIDPLVRADAQGSLDWRLDMWQALLPQVPQHLWLGKGYAITQEDWEVMSGTMNFRVTDPAEQALALGMNYHSGPLSVILPFGVWGCIAVIWIFIAGLWALYRNHRYGDERLKIINTALYALFITHVITFFFIFGDLASDTITFAGYLGLSICLNGGICKKTASAPAAKLPVPGRRAISPPPFRPAFSKNI